MTDLDAALRARLAAGAQDAGFLRHAEAVAAISAVLDLRPPERDEHDDEFDYALLTDGWWACRDAVAKVISRALGVPDGHGGGA